MRMNKKLMTKIEIYQREDGRFLVHRTNRFNEQREIVSYDDENEDGDNSFEFYANAVCVAVGELVK
jgi:hypothetical protein